MKLALVVVGLFVLTDVAVMDKQGKLPLVEACRGGHVGTVRDLISRGADVNEKDGLGMSPLIAAVTIKDKPNESFELVQLLLDRGAHSSVKYLGMSALLGACIEGYVKVARLLLTNINKTMSCTGGVANCTADIIHDPDSCGTTPLIAAVSKPYMYTSSLELVQLLLANGAKSSLNAQDDNGMSAFLWVCRNGYVDIAELLLANGADLGVTDNNSTSVLVWAMKSKDLDIVHFLLENGMEVNNEGESMMLLASQTGHLEIIKRFVENGMSVDFRGLDEGRTALMWASLGGHTNHIKIMQYMLKQGANVNEVDNDNQSALLIACEYGNMSPYMREAVIELLLKHGADVDQQSFKRWTALMRASLNGHIGVARILLQYNPQVNLKDSEGFTALMRASGECDKGGDMVELLIKHSPVETDIQIKIEKDYRFGGKVYYYHTLTGSTLRIVDGMSALMIASQCKKTDNIQILLKHNANINLQDDEGVTSLMSACIKKHYEATKLLLNHGARADLQDKRRKSALMHIITAWQPSFRMKEIVNLLLKRDTEDQLELKDEFGETCFIVACRYNCTLVVKLLLNHTKYGPLIDLDMLNDQQESALIIASRRGYGEIAQLLLVHGADVNLQAVDGYTALMRAAERCDRGIVESLLKYGAKIDIQNSEPYVNFEAGMLPKIRDYGIEDADGMSALVLTSQCEKSEIAQILIHHGTDVNLQDNVGVTPLMIACLKGRYCTAKFLLSKGARVDSHDKRGMFPLMYASCSCKKELVELLLNNGAEKQINMKDKNGNTAIMVACECGCISVMRFLLSHPKYGPLIDLDVENNFNETASSIAGANGDKELINILLDHKDGGITFEECDSEHNSIMCEEIADLGPERTRMEYFTSILTEPLPQLLTILIITVTLASVILYYYVLPTSNYIEQPRYTEEDEGKLSLEKYPIKVPLELNMEKLKDFAKEQVEIVIHVVKDCELNAALQYMTPPEFDGEIKLKNCVRYPRDNSTLGIFGTYKVALVQTEMGGNAEEEIETAVLKDFPNSKYVIALGMAYGRKQICNLGDVLVSKEIHDMSKKVTFSAGNITSHGGEQTVQLNLVHVFTRGERIWTLKKGFERTKSTGSEKSKAIVGTILSPPWLVKDERIKEMIFAHKSDAIGGEMEGNVLTRLRDFIKRHHEHRSLGIIIIKGVADHGNRKKNDKWQFTASMAAADYTSFKLGNAILCQ